MLPLPTNPETQGYFLSLLATRTINKSFTEMKMILQKSLICIYGCNEATI